MNISRRKFITSCTVAGIAGLSILNELLAAKTDLPGIRVGVCDWSLGIKGPDALDAAKRIKLDGIEISPANGQDVLSYADPEVQKNYKLKVKETGVVISSLAITIMNKYPLATDPRGQAWLGQTIDATESFGAGVILLAFFGRGDLLEKGGGKLNKEAVDAAVVRLKAAAPRAKEKGVILGIENTLSAEQNIQILDAVGHDAVKVYYDIANSAKNGYNVPAEIKMLKDRICQFHFKDNKGPFNSGDPEVGPIIDAVKAIGYQGWIILERAFGDDKEAYFSQNAKYVRNAFGLKEPDYTGLLQQ